MSSTVTMAMGTITGRRPRNAWALAANGTRNAAPSTVRLNTTPEGGRCSTATRMSRNNLAPDDRGSREQQQSLPAHGPGPLAGAHASAASLCSRAYAHR